MSSFDPTFSAALPISEARDSAERAPASRERVAREAAVVALFDTFRSSIFRYVLSLGLWAQDAEEIVQDTFLALFEHLERRPKNSNLRGWLFAVAHNIAVERLQQLRRDNLSALPAGGAEGHGFADAAQNPEQRASDAQQQLRLQAVFRALPELDRRCLLLRAEGLRYREIGAVLGISLGGVANSMARSLGKLSRAGGK